MHLLLEQSSNFLVIFVSSFLVFVCISYYWLISQFLYQLPRPSFFYTKWKRRNSGPLMVYVYWTSPLHFFTCDMMSCW